jgi:hypothetical protein
MDIQTRKLKAIEFLIGLNDESVLTKIESTILKQKKAIRNLTSFSPMTQEQIIKRAQMSSSDYLSGNFVSQEQLEKESENW